MGDICRNASPPPTTKRRITTNLKTINNQNCQKFKLHGSPTTKELKKHSSRPVGVPEMGSWAERTRCKVAGHAGQVGLADQETKDSKVLAVKSCGGCKGRRNSQSHRRIAWKVGLERNQQATLFPLTPPPQAVHQRNLPKK